MSKFKNNNLLLKSNQKILLGNSQESEIQFDGSSLQLSSNSPTQLQYGGATVFATLSNGISIADGVTSAKLYIHDNVDLYFNNETYGGRIILTGRKLDGTVTQVLRSDPDNETSLYYAGVEKFKTFGYGVRITDQVINLTPSGFGSTEIKNNGNFGITHNEPGGHIGLVSKNSSDNPNDLFLGDPDGEVNLYYAGSLKFQTQSGGINVLGSRVLIKKRFS